MGGYTVEGVMFNAPQVIKQEIVWACRKMITRMIYRVGVCARFFNNYHQGDIPKEVWYTPYIECDIHRHSHIIYGTESAEKHPLKSRAIPGKQ